MKKIFIVVLLALSFFALSRSDSRQAELKAGITHPWPTCHSVYYAYNFSIRAEIIEISPGDYQA